MSMSLVEAGGLGVTRLKEMFSAPYRYQSEGAVSGESHQVRPCFSSVTRTIGAPVSRVKDGGR